MVKAIKEYSLADLMERIEEIFNQNPGPINGFNAVVQYDVYGEEKGTYQHFFKNGNLTIKKGVETTPTCTMQLSYDNFKKFVLGKQSGTMALLTGRVRVLGNLSTAMRIETILRRYNIREPF
ncbi:SCP2 sterol-binding domain-containing protein [Bacillus sp. OK048]|uniref:SCP2 sterol-binding domain-containing protein n=1 Tax=Bacillus sp. OK048 TaxID=1882761 RepID=UPI0008902A5B|nr:SCP2 sterol-binding domain-containing protein [Bacillus sp. OK048]SDM62848.1 Putative sterol carrier protein [Bacillus sp. OK048]